MPATDDHRMTDRTDDAVPVTRTAVRRLVADAVAAGLLASRRLAVAVSGGADSLALASAVAYVAPRFDLECTGLIVDHQLQAESAAVAASAAQALWGLGFPDVRVLPVEVTGPGGTEAAARRARYTALRDAMSDTVILLGHTRDDQAETVLLGLGRGSGPRSIAGMRPLDPPWGRPFLDVSRATTVAACARLGLHPWTDPHNSDTRFTRVRLRTEVLPLLEDVLSGGVAKALARTATQLREDADVLDALARDALTAARCPGEADLAVRALATQPGAIRRRVLRGWLLDAGVVELSDAQLRSADALIGAWRGQGGVWLPGGLVVTRAHGRLRIGRTDTRDSADDKRGAAGSCTTTTSPPC
jgi:tRNA(Ile)-lysidine synthase